MKVSHTTALLLFTGVVIGVIFIYFLYLINQKNCLTTEHFASDVAILSAQETSDFLSKDEDFYVQNMSKYDLIARKSQSYSEYLKRIATAAHEPSQWETKRLAEATAEVDRFLSTSRSKDYATIFSRLSTVPWKIAVVSGKEYENGYPHTRGEVIFIPNTLILSSELEKTLLHEKVHLYQRAYPQEIDTWIRSRGFARWKTRVSEALSRANPDLDAWIYVDPATQKPMAALYNSEEPASISDVKLTNFSFEHPYEMMAYEIADKFVVDK